MKDWKKLQAEIDQKALETLTEPDIEMKRLAQYHMSVGGAGVTIDKTIFSTLLYGICDCIRTYDWIYFINTLAQDDDYTAEDIAEQVAFFFKQPSFFADYCGLRTQYRFTLEICEVMGSLKKEDLVSLLDSFRCYIGNLAAWAYQYIPWGIGYAFPARDKAYFEQGLAYFDK